MKHYQLLVLVALFSSTKLASQKNYQCNTTALEQLQKHFHTENTKKEARVNSYLNLKNLEDRSVRLGDKEMSIIDIRHGQPIYYITHNEESARSLGVDALRPGGRFGLDLAGEAINIGVWDRGLPKADHNEFQGRLLNSDASSETSFHSTHVTGTIIAGGVNPSARGFCYRANARAFDWFQDTEEMIDEVIMNQMTVSNHSYGVPGGWNGANWLGDLSVSDEEDYRFGFYDQEAQAFDQIAYNAPYYSIVVSAGNERGDSGDGTFPPDGPYDCITGFSTAKNVFTIGAVNKLNSGYSSPQDVVMSSFSSWGPVDDGRIKPDFCAPGVGLLSSSNESVDSYAISNGTSMSSPSVAGAVSLINEAYLTFNNSLLKSATLKGLMIQTALEAGSSPGPDYQFGWGLVSVDGAVDFIQKIDGLNRRIVEGTLNNGDEIALELNPKQGEKITATIAWTDPAGNPVERSLDPVDLMLVNDLDLTIEDLGGTVAEPWILNPAMPSSPASQGNNFRDNVEKVEFESPDAKPYTLRVSHKGNLVNGAQDFSLILEYTSEDAGISNVYWINGDGEWADDTHWSSSSGGGPAMITPDVNSKVIIDDNSIPGATGIISLETDVEIASIVAFTEKEIIIDLNNNKLSIRGTTNISAPTVTFRNGHLEFNGDSSESSNVLNFNGSIFENTNITIAETNMASWQMDANELSLDTFEFNAGRLGLVNTQINASHLRFGGTLELDNCIFRADENFEFMPGIELLESGANRLEILNAGSCNVDFHAVPNEFITHVRSAHINLSAQGELNQLLLDEGSVAMLSRIELYSLNANAGSEIQLMEDLELILNGLELMGSIGNPIVLQGTTSNQRPSIVIDEREKYCFDHLNISNVDLKGEAAVSVGLNSSLTESDGWFDGPCADLLFANFEADFLCAGALSSLRDISDGDALHWQWYINGDFVGEGQNFEYHFEAAGNYDVRLVIEDGSGNSDGFTQTLMVSDSDLAENTIFSNATQLVSTNLAEAYQWYNYGEAIAGATQRIYVYNGEPGIYWVLTIEGDCNRRSEILNLDETNVVDLDKEDNNLLKILGNPVNKELEIEWLQDMNGAEIKIFDISGKLQHTQKLLGGRYFSLDTHDFINGLYTILIRINDVYYVKSFIKVQP